MEALCQATGPVRHVSSSRTSQLKQLPSQAASAECGLGGGVALQPSLNLSKHLSSNRHGVPKRRVQVWSLDFRSESAPGVEKSICKAQADNVRNIMEVAVTGVPSSAVEGYPPVGNSVAADGVNEEAANEEQIALSCSGVVSRANDATPFSSVNGDSQSGPANVNTGKRASGNGCANGNTCNGVSQKVSVNGTVLSVSHNSGDNGHVNGHAVNGVHTNGSAVTDLSVNGLVNGVHANNSAVNGPGSAAVNGYSPANGSATLLPELRRPVTMPPQILSAQDEKSEADDVLDVAMSVKTFVPPKTGESVPATTAQEIQTSWNVAEVSDQRPSAEDGGGLGILKFLKGKHILVTGATGFLAKVLVEKILRVQPDIGQLYLIIQPQSNATADDRLRNTVFKSRLFDVLRSYHGDEFENFMKKKLTAVSGTISANDLGLDSSMAEDLSKKVDVIVNSAATTAFDERSNPRFMVLCLSALRTGASDDESQVLLSITRYDVALNINTQGPRRLLDFAKGCSNLQLFLHVSTAFVNGQRKGRTPEKPFQMGDSIAKEMQGDKLVPDLDVGGELELAAKVLLEAETSLGLSISSKDDPMHKLFVDKKMMELGMARAQLFGWQDTYVFSKAMGEMVLDAERGDVPVVVLRPSVVESTLAEPFPGWMEGIRMMDPIVLAYGKGQMTGFLADPNGVLDVIPADMVVNALLAAMTKHAQQPGLQVYQVASSVVNPMTFNILADVALELFRKDPMLDRAGKPIKVDRMRFVENMQAFNLYMWFKYRLPVQLSKIVPWMKGGRMSQKRTLILQKTLEQFKYLASIYRPYTFYAGRFDVVNTESLLKELSAEELERFSFPIRSIDWAHYLYNIHIPGLRQFVLKGRGTKT